MSKLTNVLFVDDEFNNLISFKASFRRHFNVHTTSDTNEAFSILDSDPIHVVLADQRMPQMLGVDFLARVRDQYPQAIRVLITAYSDIDGVINAINKGEVYRYIAKPWDEDAVIEIIKSAYAKYQDFANGANIRDDISLLSETAEHYVGILKKIGSSNNHDDIVKKVNRTAHLSQEILATYALEDAKNNLSVGTTKSKRLSLQDYTALIRIHDVKVILSYTPTEQYYLEKSIHFDMFVQVATLFSEIAILPQACRQSLQKHIQALQ